MRRLVLAVVLAMLSFATAAQQYPSRPIHLVATFAAGGAMDLTARSMAAVMSESFGQVIVENRTGGGEAGRHRLRGAPRPDGYTLVMYADVNVIAPFVYKKLNHDPIKDFAPITNAILGTHLIVGHPSVKANSLKELIELAKREPGKLTFGSPGTARRSTSPVSSSSSRPAGLDIQHVPYRGGGQLIGDLVGGQIPLGLIGLPPTLPHIKAGKLKVFAVTARKRSPSLPDVPTVEEAGLPGYETVQWLGPAAPAGTPRPIIDRLHAEFVKALRNPTVVERLTKAGLEVAPSESPDAYARVHPRGIRPLARHRESRGGNAGVRS